MNELREGDLLTITKVLRILPVGRATVYALVASGRLPSYRVRAAGSRRGRVLVHRRDLEAFLAGCRDTPPRAPQRLDLDEIHARVRRRAAGA